MCPHLQFADTLPCRPQLHPPPARELAQSEPDSATRRAGESDGAGARGIAGREPAGGGVWPQPPFQATPRSGADARGEDVADELADRLGGELVKVPPGWWPYNLESHVVESIFRRVDHRGSDVRLDLGVLFRPSPWPGMSIDPGKWQWKLVISTPWRGPAEHINVLELRAGLLALRWRSRDSSFFGQRFVHLMDSQVALAVATKGRSSAAILNRVLVKQSALLIAVDACGIFGYVATEVNPADFGSRVFDHG